MFRLALLSYGILFASPFTWAAEFPTFREQVIDPHCGEVCYAVTLADVDGDKRQDIVAVTENRVLWYQAPDWKKRVIIEDQTTRDNVCIAPLDIDGDGQVDFALGAGWTKVGTIQWLSRGKSLDDKWNVHFIGEERWLHRMRFADVLGLGKPQLVISPLNATQGKGVRLTAFTIPKNPRTDAWPRTVLDGELNRMHNHWHTDLNGDQSVDTIAASREGVYWIRRDGKGFQKTKIGEGIQGADPNSSGAGEVKTGQLKNGTRFLTTVEPMHGTHLVVYLEPKGKKPGQLWERHVLDESLRRGHALWTADLDGDGSDEIVIGHSDEGPGPVKGPGVYVFDAQSDDGTKWTKHILDDGGIATEDAVAADLTGDGRVDIVAGGRATHNIKLYINEGPQGAK
ncbi:MAG: VCBS repeat-containing protein [Planctomycetaceae bacterium]|nr:VCBS repeat-containing protein [Planctomycetaceae bacterium]